MECKIVVPSRKRAELIELPIKGVTLLVDEVEKNDYLHLKNDYEIITHKSLKSLAEIRNFAYKKFGDVFMIDDDVISVERLYAYSDAKLNSNEIKKIIQDCYLRANDVGAFLFGFNNNPNPKNYKFHKPFMFKGYINGCAVGLIKNDNLFFTEKTTACESHWINLLNAYHNRFCFIDKRFHFRQKANSTFTLKGGQSGKRTMETEKNDTLFLKKMFGDSVKLKKDTKSQNQLHPYQRQLKIRL